MRIGLTGSIATGKSTVADMIRGAGYPVIDADVIAREVVEPGTPALEEIKSHFGDSVLYEDGSLNRVALGDIIFHSKQERETLNSIVHPAVRAEMKRQAEDHEEAGAEDVFMDIPLLFESGLEHMVYRTMVVYVQPEIQLRRLMKRDQLDMQRAVERMQAQWSIEEKRERADVVIDNGRSQEETRIQLMDWLNSKYRTRQL
ncbi:dephospho-CoA kinase [Alkalicoccus chagannorensis]|uniref:dephospho-CoA kinase n=1 Tax=Alkalicoccus chagannorensis TaxID=427072 RepID=UPI0003F861EC|nr:dephospho-CoA kinase [Alkalicoccus chagannorensis]